MSIFVPAQSAITANVQTGTTYTLRASDNGKVVTFSNTLPITVIVPTGLAIGFQVILSQLGSGQVSIISASGVTVGSRSSITKMLGQYSTMTLLAIAQDVFVLRGDAADQQLAAGTKVYLFGDSHLAFGVLSVTGAAPEFSQQWRGEINWALSLDPRFRVENFRDTTRVWGVYTGVSGTLGANPFSTTNLSGVVTVTHVGHGIPVGGAYLGDAEYVFSGSTAVAGLSLNSGFKVISVIDANTFTINAPASTVANATTTGGGSAVSFKQRGDAGTRQNIGTGSNWASAGDWSNGTLDILQPDNGFPSSAMFNRMAIANAIALVEIGTNDINNNQSLSAIQARVSALVARLLALGFARVVILTAPPHDASRTENLPANPFSTTSGSAVVTVSHPNTTFSPGQQATFAGAASVGGLTLTGPYPILASTFGTGSPFTADSYQINVGSTASATATGGGASVTATNSLAQFVWPIDDPRWAVLKAYNDWLRTNPFGSNVKIVDLDQVLVDPGVVVQTSSGAIGAYRRNYTVDGIHKSGLAAYMTGRYSLLPAMQSLVAPGTWFETDPNATGNLIINAALSGTTGSSSTGITGTVPSSWTHARFFGSAVLSNAASSVVVAGTNKVNLAVTTATSANPYETLEMRAAPLAWNLSGTAAVVTANIQTSGANPTVQITQTAINNGAPIVGGQVVIANVLEGVLNGVNLAGTWTVTSVSVSNFGTNAVYTFVATGQTASATGSASRTIDYTFDSRTVLPLGTYLRMGFLADVGAWTKWRNVSMMLTSRNAAATVFTWRGGRGYDPNRRLFPNEAWSGWVLSEPMKLDAETMANVTNLLPRILVDVEMNADGSTGTIGISKPFLRIATDPTTLWV